MPFVGEIFSQLKTASDVKVLLEIRDGQITGVTGGELLELIRKARTFLAAKGLKKGERCGILAANSIRWMALDLAAMAEGLIVVPLYFRQAPAELVAMMKDSTPSLVCCGEAALCDGIQQNWSAAPPHFLFDEIFAGVEGTVLDRPQVRDEDPVTIIYTSGTSGEAKGVVLTAANVGFMLGCTSARLDELMGGRTGQDRIFHYLPLSFCASWIAVLTFLLRGSLVTLNTDLAKIPNAKNLADEARISPYHLGSWAYIYTIGYRSDLIKTIKFDSWNDLWKPELKGKIAAPDFDPSHIIAVSAMLSRSLGVAEAALQNNAFGPGWFEEHFVACPKAS